MLRAGLVTRHKRSPAHRGLYVWELTAAGEAFAAEGTVKAAAEIDRVAVGKIIRPLIPDGYYWIIPDTAKDRLRLWTLTPGAPECLVGEVRVNGFWWASMVTEPGVVATFGFESDLRHAVCNVLNAADAGGWSYMRMELPLVPALGEGANVGEAALVELAMRATA